MIDFKHILVFLIIKLLCGCAVSYDDEDTGTRHVYGFVWMEYPLQPEEPPVESPIALGEVKLEQSPPVISQDSLGLYLDISDHSGGFGFGYRNHILVTPPPHRIMTLDYDSSAPFETEVEVIKLKSEAIEEN